MISPLRIVVTVLLFASTLAVADETCETLVERPPSDPRSCECFRDFHSIESLLFDERLATWSRLDTLDPWRHAAIGARYLERDPPRARAELESALRSFITSNQAVGEAYVRLLRARDAQRMRRVDDVRTELAAAESLILAADDAILNAWQVQVESSELNFESRYEAALGLTLPVVYAESFATLPRSLRYHLLVKCESSARFTERYSEALAFGRRGGELCGTSAGCRAEYLSGIAATLRHMLPAGLVLRDDAIRATREAYEAAKETGKTWAEFEAACEMGALMPPEESIEWNQRCETLTETLACPDVRVTARMRIAEARAEADPSRIAESIRTVEGLLGESRRYSTTLDVAGGHATLARLYELNGQSAAAIAALEKAIEIREKIRDRQADPISRASVLSRSARYYYRLATNLALAPDPSDVERAFATMEALRGRTLLDQRASPTNTDSAADDGADRAQLAQTVARIGAVQTQLAQPALTQGEIDLLLGELDRLEAGETELASRIERANPAWAEARRPHIAALVDVRQRLRDDEAMILLQLPPTEIAEGWALVITGANERVVRLPAFDTNLVTSLYLGAIVRRTDVPAGMGSALYQALFSTVLEALPPGIRRLVIVPDGPVARLPVAALVDPATGISLVERYDLSLVSSATSWLALRDSGDGRLASGALGFGDVTWSRAEGSPEATRSLSISDMRLALPRSRDEIRAMLDAVPGPSRAFYGRRASETSLKQLDLTPFGIVHFATHAVVNGLHPSRSAILLAAGDAGEDGLLQPREIAQLRLDGKLVVLSACGSANGRDLTGEGPLSLARVFLQAGARAVVGTIWPVRDSEAAVLAEAFYDRLARGDTATQALAAAQREQLAAGAPVAAWAGFVLIGDGDVTLAKNSASRKTAWLGIGAAAIVFALGLVVLLVRAYRRGDRSAHGWTSSRITPTRRPP